MNFQESDDQVIIVETSSEEESKQAIPDQVNEEIVQQFVQIVDIQNSNMERDKEISALRTKVANGQGTQEDNDDIEILERMREVSKRTLKRYHMKLFVTLDERRLN